MEEKKVYLEDIAEEVSENDEDVNMHVVTTGSSTYSLQKTLLLAHGKSMEEKVEMGGGQDGVERCEKQEEMEIGEDIDAENEKTLGLINYKYDLPEVAFLFHKLNQHSKHRYSLVQNRKEEERVSSKKERGNKVTTNVNDINATSVKTQTELQIEEIEFKLKKRLEENEEEMKEMIYQRNLNIIRKSFNRWQKVMKREGRFSEIKSFTRNMQNQFLTVCDVELEQLEQDCHKVGLAWVG
jgi:hypothetical protein